MAIIEVDDLIDYMSDIDLSSDQRTAAEFVIAGAQAEVESYLGRPLERVTRTETLVPDLNGVIWPYATPIVSVSGITYLGNGGVILPMLVPVVNPGSNGIYVGWGYGPVTITYVGGLHPQAVPIARLTVLRIAAREMENRHDDTLSVRDLSTDSSDPNPLGMQPEDERRLERWRHRTVVTG